MLRTSILYHAPEKKNLEVTRCLFTARPAPLAYRTFPLSLSRKCASYVLEIFPQRVFLRKENASGTLLRFAIGSA